MPILRLIGHRVQSEWIVRSLRTRNVMVGEDTRFIGWPVIELVPLSSLQLGRGTRIVSVSSRTALGVNHAVVLRTLLPGAVIRIGNDVGISGGSICSAIRIEIGDGTMLGANVTVADTDFHPLDDRARRYAPLPEPRPEDGVSIGSNVFIGTGATILRGTYLGDDCVVGAGAVVKGHFGAGQVLAGNPARIIRRVSKSADYNSISPGREGSAERSELA